MDLGLDIQHNLFCLCFNALSPRKKGIYWLQNSPSSSSKDYSGIEKACCKLSSNFNMTLCMWTMSSAWKLTLPVLKLKWLQSFKSSAIAQFFLIQIDWQETSTLSTTILNIVLQRNNIKGLPEMLKVASTATYSASQSMADRFTSLQWVASAVAKRRVWEFEAMNCAPFKKCCFNGSLQIHRKYRTSTPEAKVSVEFLRQIGHTTH